MAMDTLAVAPEGAASLTSPSPPWWPGGTLPPSPTRSGTPRAHPIRPSSGRSARSGPDQVFDGATRQHQQPALAAWIADFAAIKFANGPTVTTCQVEGEWTVRVATL